MTRLRWPGRSIPDPGAVIEVTDFSKPVAEPISPRERERRKVKQERAKRKLFARSDRERLEAINRKRAKLGLPPLSSLP